ncbi:MAG: murein biosynthesis integral membrane protein MurJ, partial [Plesiomonas sp.]
FPLGLFGIAIATVILPALSRRYNESSGEHFAKTMDWGVRMIFLLGVPAMCGIAVLAKPMMMVLFMRGEFTFADVNAASLSLLAFNCGLVSFMLIKVLAPGYYARQDTKTPVRYGIISMVSNMGFNLLAIPFSYVGLAIASAMSGTLNAWLLYRGLSAANVYKFSRQSWLLIAKVVVAGLGMAATLFWVMPDIAVWQNQHNMLRMVWLAGLIGLAAVVYVVLLLLLGVRPRHLRADTDIAN